MSKKKQPARKVKGARIKARVWRGTGWVYDCFAAYRKDHPPGVCCEQTPAFKTKVCITMTEIVPIPTKRKASK